MKDLLDNWFKRHRNTTSFWLHMIGLPACFVITPMLLIMRQWWLAMAFFVVGYAVQFIGHAVEGNRSGEEMMVRKVLRIK